LERVGRNGQLAAEGEPGVDVVPLTEPADLGHAPGGREAELEGVAVAEPPGQLADRTPVPGHEPAVATARPPAADVLLQQYDVDARIALLQEVGRPHAAVAAAQDHDIGGRVRRERRTWVTRIVRQRFGQPPSARRAQVRDLIHLTIVRGRGLRLMRQPCRGGFRPYCTYEGPDHPASGRA